VEKGGNFLKKTGAQIKKGIHDGFAEADNMDIDYNKGSGGY
jgi:hypothetical protein